MIEIMSQTTFLLSTLTLLVIYVSDIVAEKHLHLPSYIVPCSKSAADFEECSRQHGQDVISIVTKGDKEYDIPPLNPLVLPSVQLDLEGFKISFKDLQVHGLDTAEVKKVKFDLNKNELAIDVYIDKVALIGKYNADGQILIMQIQGDGNMNVTITGFEINYRANYKLVEKGGDAYIVIPNDADIQYTMTRAYFDFDNLFGGNQQLGDATLKALNDEWDQFMDVLKPVISETISKIIESITAGVTSNVPLKYIFLD